MILITLTTMAVCMAWKLLPLETYVRHRTRILLAARFSFFLINVVVNFYSKLHDHMHSSSR